MNSAQAARWFGSEKVPVWYLISCRRNNRLVVLTVFPASEAETVPVFTTGAAAESFLRRCDFGSDWRVRETTAGELISLLLSHLSDATRVATDPAGPAEPDLAGIAKREFIGALMGEPLLIPAV